MKQIKRMLRYHWPLVGLLPLFLALGLTFSVTTPLGEAPDEPAHFSYAQFIAKNGRLPATLSERAAAGYRSSWPPLYHMLVAGPIAAVGDEPPTRLKAIGDSPRRLIPTNGQTIASFIHTNDEGWPWRGITLAWHLARLLSLLFSALAVTITYVIAWKITRQRWLAAGAAAVHAFLPQFLFIGTVVTDDTLLILLGGLVLLALVLLGQHNSWPHGWQFGLLGVLLGLATITKYNALPLWAIVIGWSFWLTYTTENDGQSWRARPARLAGALVWIGLGATLTAGWWFWFVWRNFNQVETAGWFRGSLAALTAGTADASLRQLSAGTGLDIPPPAAWFEWYIMLLKSFWGLFGGGGTIEFAGWVYGMLLVIILLALIGLIKDRRVVPFLLIPLFFLPLLMLRFVLSGSIVETAQGRHLFPALAAIAIVLVCGISGFEKMVTRRSEQAKLISSRGVLVAILLLLTLSAIIRIQSSYPPHIPLRTTVDPDAGVSSLRAELAPGVVLAGIEINELQNNTLPVELLWEATAIPAADYLIQLTVENIDGQTVGGWMGHPIGGRYPTRAWDPGDMLTDTIPVPLASRTAGELTVRVSLLDAAGTAVGEGYAERTRALTEPGEDLPLMPSELRTDGLAADEPFSYRGTISIRSPELTSAPLLTNPSGEAITPDWFSLVGFAHFIVEADWPSGDYTLSINQQSVIVPVSNRIRRFDSPEMQYRVNANFADYITLLGYDLPEKTVRQGDSLPITLHLQTNRTMAENLAIFNHLLDSKAVQRGGVDRIPKLYYTTLLWVPGEVVSDSYLVPVDADAPSGIYWLDTGFYPTDRPDLSLPLMVEGQPIERNSVAIGPIKVGGPPPGVTASEASPQVMLNTTFSHEITLLGFDWELDRSTIETEGSANAITTLTLYWQAIATPQSDYTVFVHLLDSAGQLAGQADGPPAAGAYPTSLWEPGEIIVDRHQLPAGLQYESINIGLYRTDTGQRLTADGYPDGAVPLSD